MRRLAWTFCALAFVCLLALAAVALSGYLLAKPARAVVGEAPADLRAESVVIPSSSGSSLRGWLVRGASGKGAAVVMHGVRGNRAVLVGRIRLLRDAGYSVLAF